MNRVPRGARVTRVVFWVAAFVILGPLLALVSLRGNDGLAVAIVVAAVALDAGFVFTMHWISRDQEADSEGFSAKQGS